MYQFTAVDLATRYIWRQVDDDRSAANAARFLRYVLKNTTFKIQSVQTDNGTEFTYRCLDTGKESEFDLLCRKLQIKRRFIPLATPRYNGVVERVHGSDEKELYQKLAKNITLDELKLILTKYNHFYNTRRLHYSLKYSTIQMFFYIQKIPFPICLTP